MTPTRGQLLPYDGPPVQWGTALDTETVCETLDGIADRLTPGTASYVDAHAIACLSGVMYGRVCTVLRELAVAGHIRRETLGAHAVYRVGKETS